MSIATIDVQPRVKTVHFNNQMFSATLQDGRILSIPMNWYPRLEQASEEELGNWIIFEDTHKRDIIFWEDIDEMIPVIALLDGTPSRESQQSFARWLERRM